MGIGHVCMVGRWVGVAWVGGYGVVGGYHAVLHAWHGCYQHMVCVWVVGMHGACGVVLLVVGACGTTTHAVCMGSCGVVHTAWWCMGGYGVRIWGSTTYGHMGTPIWGYPYAGSPYTALSWRLGCVVHTRPFSGVAHSVCGGHVTHILRGATVGQWVQVVQRPGHWVVVVQREVYQMATQVAYGGQLCLG